MTSHEPESVRSSYDPTRGPKGETAPDDGIGVPVDESDDDDLVGAPGAGPGEPSTPHGSSGQDAGSMD